MRKALADLAETEELHGHNSGQLWRELGDVRPLADDADKVLWKISVPPQSGPDVAARLAGERGADYFYDWGGGLVWLALDTTDDARHESVRAAVAETGGHATLVRAPDTVRAAVPVFHPQDAAKAALTQRVKEGFDPRGVLNPGRMVEGV